MEEDIPKNQAYDIWLMGITIIALPIVVKFGGVFGLPPSGISFFWPPNALVVCACLYLPARRTVQTLLLAGPAYFLGELWIGFAPLPSVFFSLANLAEILVAVLLLKLFLRPGLSLRSVRSVVLFGLSAAGAAIIGGLSGGLAIYSGGGLFLETALRWGLADFMGFIVVVPLIFGLQHFATDFSQKNRNERAELVFTLSLLTVISATVYSQGGLDEAVLEGLFYLPIPIALWLSIRCGAAFSALGAAIVFSSAMYFEIHGSGPFSHLSPEHNLYSLQLFSLSILISTALVAAVAEERIGLIDDLEDRVRDRTAELEVAKNQSEAANRAKSNFLAAMSHDLRTPLNSVIGFVQLLEAQTFGPINNPKYHEYHNIIHRSAAHLLEVVEEILDLSRLESEQFRLRSEPYDPVAHTKDVIETLEPIAAEANVTIELSTSQNLPAMIMGDKRIVTQLQNNLISNAIRYAPSGSSINVSWDLDENSDIVFQVKDDGAGFPDHVLENFGSPFVVSELNHDLDAKKSYGLGLYICKRYIEVRGGQLELENSENGGAIVTAKWPLDKLKVEVEKPTFSQS